MPPPFLAAFPNLGTPISRSEIPLPTLMRTLRGDAKICLLKSERSFDSHQGGNYALWALNKLCNANKHRLLIPVGITHGGMAIRRMTATGGISFPFAPFDRIKNQIVTARVGPNGTFEYDMQLSFSVQFDDFNGVKGGPAVGVLDAIASEVDRVLRATEAECRRIGLIH
jgi:hypothetical protein